MWPVIERGAPPAASSMPYLVSSSAISSSVSQMGISMATVLEVVREHEILQRLVPQFVGADGRDDERGGCGCRVLFAIDDDAVGIGERRARLRGAGLWIVLAAEELVRAR